MGQSPSSESPHPGQRPPEPPSFSSPASSAAPPSACPVDHKSRDVWLRAAAQEQLQQQQQQQQQPPTQPQSSEPSSRKRTPFTTAGTAPFPQPKLTNTRLSTDRQVSSIPRAAPSPSAPSATTTSSTSTSVPTASHASPTYSNAETPDLPAAAASPFWLYPSESQFYAAVLRKQHSPPPDTISAVVPIHNAVNERTWTEILRWEASAHLRPALRGADGGSQEEEPQSKLVSFAGDSERLTPRARVRGWMGYRRPFDRHDWVVERSPGGQRVEYVIDFYEGRAPRDGERKPGGLNFYLDVRPKLNSWEGVRMRVWRALGW